MSQEPSRDKIRVGFVGAGRHATRTLYPALAFAPIELIAVSALGEAEAHRAARSFGAERYYVNRLEEMLEKEHLDACLVAVSLAAYREVLGKILEAGLPIWCEKPAGNSVAQVAEVEQLSLRAGKPVQVGFMKRFTPTFQMARAAMARSGFGRPTSFVGKFVVGAEFYSDEYTYLVDNPIHLIDAARFFMGEVARVSVERAEWGDRRWSYMVLLRFVNGAVGALHFANTQSWRQHNEFIEITGEGNFITVDNVVRYRFHPKDGPGEAWEPNWTVPSLENQSLVQTGYVNELVHFAHVVQDGAKPQATLTDARRAFELIDEIYNRGGGTLTPDRPAAG